MAVEADTGPRLGIVERDQPLRHIAGMAGTDSIMTGEPAGRCAVTGFAADTIVELKPGTLAGCRRAVAAQAFRRRGRVLDPQTFRYRDTARFAEDPKGAAMGAARGRFFLPAHDFVLPDDLAIGFLPSVTSGSSARCHAQSGAAGAIGGGGDSGRACHGRDEHCRCDQGRTEQAGGQHWPAGYPRKFFLPLHRCPIRFSHRSPHSARRDPCCSLCRHWFPNTISTGLSIAHPLLNANENRPISFIS